MNNALDLAPIKPPASEQRRISTSQAVFFFKLALFSLNSTKHLYSTVLLYVLDQHLAQFAKKN